MKSSSGRYEIIVEGERRWRACMELGVLVLFFEERSADTPEQKATLERMFIAANERRADRSYASKCLLMADTSKRLGNPSNRDLAETIGVSQGSVAQRLSHALLVELIRDAVVDLESAGRPDFEVLSRLSKASEGKLRDVVSRAGKTRIKLATLIRDMKIAGGRQDASPANFKITTTRTGTRCELSRLNPDQIKALEAFLKTLFTV